MNKMKLYDICCDLDYRNLFLDVVSYLSYSDVQNLFLVDKKTHLFLKDWMKRSENQNIIDKILSRKYFDKGNAKLYIDSEMSCPSSSITKEKSFWRSYYPKIENGDIIFLNKCGKYIQIGDYPAFVRHTIDERRNKSSSVFPLEFWQDIGRKNAFRMWIHVEVFYDTIEVWRSRSYVRFMGFNLDPKLFDKDQRIELFITYDEELIYIYPSHHK